MYKFFEVEIDKLFYDTLYKTYSIRPYAFYKNEFVGLRLRYEFVQKWIDNNYILQKKEIVNTKYWKILNKTINDLPREGGKNWVYSNPTFQVERFISLAKYIQNHGYIVDQKSNVLDNFETLARPHIEIDKSKNINEVDYKNREYNGIIEVITIPGTKDLSVHNGNHRIAILKCFRDNGIFSRQKIKVKHFDEPKNLNYLLKKTFRKLYKHR